MAPPMPPDRYWTLSFGTVARTTGGENTIRTATSQSIVTTAVMAAMTTGRSPGPAPRLGSIRKATSRPRPTPASPNESAPIQLAEVLIGIPPSGVGSILPDRSSHDPQVDGEDRKSTRLNSSHLGNS